MRVAACVMALLTGATMGVRAQNFINLGFEQALLPDIEHGFILTWSQGAPGWSHNPSADGDYLGYPVVNVGYSVSYALYPLAGCCETWGTGSFALAMHSGTFYEQEPRGGLVQAAVWQTGTIRPGVTTVNLMASNAAFSLSLDGTVIDLRPVGLDPASPTYESDLLAYGGEWSGDVSAFAGQLVELRVASRAPDERLTLVIDDIRFLPVPEPSTAMLLGLGTLIVPFAAAWSTRARRARRGLSCLGSTPRRSER